MEIKLRDLEQCRTMLDFYDIDQGGWEQQPHGFVANVEHVHYHLSRDIARKDFSNGAVVTDELAPDALAYAVRLGRWAALPVADVLPTVATDRYLSTEAGRFGTVPDHFVAWILASSELGDALHGMGHKSEFGEAVSVLPKRTKKAAQLLLHCANLQAEQHDTPLKELLQKRLTSLRDRFGIEHPAESVTYAQG